MKLVNEKGQFLKDIGLSKDGELSVSFTNDAENAATFKSGSAADFIIDLVNEQKPDTPVKQEAVEVDARTWQEGDILSPTSKEGVWEAGIIHVGDNLPFGYNRILVRAVDRKYVEELRKIIVDHLNSLEPVRDAQPKG